jgi:hypothetical protein
VTPLLLALALAAAPADKAAQVNAVQARILEAEKAVAEHVASVGRSEAEVRRLAAVGDVTGQAAAQRLLDRRRGRVRDWTAKLEAARAELAALLAPPAKPTPADMDAQIAVAEKAVKDAQAALDAAKAALEALRAKRLRAEDDF